MTCQQAFELPRAEIGIVRQRHRAPLHHGRPPQPAAAGDDVLAVQPAALAGQRGKYRRLIKAPFGRAGGPAGVPDDGQVTRRPGDISSAERALVTSSSYPVAPGGRSAPTVTSMASPSAPAARKQHQGKPDQPRRPLAPLSPFGSIPENGPAGGARTRLVVPGVPRVRAVGSAWRLERDLAGVRKRRLRGSGRWRAVRRRRPSGIRHSGSRFGFRRGGISHVVPQGRPDDLPAPLRTGPLGELRPRQHLVYPRHVILGDGNPEHDGDAGCVRQPGTRHAFKVPRTAGLERERLRVEPAKNNQAKGVGWGKTTCSAIRSKSLTRQGKISSRCSCGPPMSGPSGPGSSVPASRGAVAQLVAHLHGMEGVRGSNPLSSTKFLQIRSSIQSLADDCCPGWGAIVGAKL